MTAGDLAPPGLAPRYPTARWGWIGTLVATLAVMVVFELSRGGFAAWYIASTTSGLSHDQIDAQLARLQHDGDALAASTFISTPLCLLALIAAVRIKRGAQLSEVLALRMPSLRALAFWLLALVAFAAASDTLTWALDRPIVPRFMADIYGGASSRVFLWIAIVAMGPVFEEALFRGFAITGLAPSRIGPVGAILLTAFAWAAIHGQYDLYGMATIAALGVLLGAARVQTDSLITPLAMHMLANLIATAEVALQQAGVFSGLR